MPTPFVVAIDQGTSATKAYRLDAAGRFTPLNSIAHAQHYPHPGWVEHDAAELLASVQACAALAHGAVALGIDNQGKTVLAWDAQTGEPVYNAIVWQDNRTQARIDALKSEHADLLTLQRAGLPLDAYFSASKLAWILQEVPQARALAARGRLRLGTSDSFFLDRLCGVYATDVTTASRTSLMNLETQQWDSELCRLFGVPPELLPEICPTVGSFGALHEGALPVVASVVDQQAALFGHGCRRPGQVKITFGTGAFALAVAGAAPLGAPGSGLLPTVAWQIAGERCTFAIDGGVYNATSALDWAGRLGLFSEYAQIDRFPGPSAIERGVVFVPALSGLACPYWDRSAAGLWLGMGLDTSREDMMQALLEGVALRAAQALAAIGGCVALEGAVSIDGGLTRNDYFCRFLARALGRAVSLPATPESTGLGCAQLAWIGAGLGDLPPTAAPLRTHEATPALDASLTLRFADAVERSRRWREP